MKTYLVEYHCLTADVPVMEIVQGENEEAVWADAYSRSCEVDYLENGNFGVYMILRNCNGELYLGDLDGDCISSAGTHYARIY